MFLLSWANKSAATNYYGYECVSEYAACDGTGSDIPNSCNNAWGFASVMAGAGYSQSTSYYETSVFDTDIMESDVVTNGHDTLYTDTPNTGIWYFSGHGECGSGSELADYCDDENICPPGDNLGCDDLTHHCRPMADRFIDTCSSYDSYGHHADLTTQVRLGEGPITGGWGGVGTNGNMDVVAFDSSCPFEHPFETQLNSQLFVGVHLELGFTGEYGDTADISDRGSHFAARLVTDSEPVGPSWIDTSRYDVPYGMEPGTCVIAFVCDYAESAANWRLTTEPYPWVIDPTSAPTTCVESMWCNF